MDGVADLREQLAAANAKLEAAHQAEAAALTAAGLGAADYQTTPEAIGLLAGRAAGLEAALRRVVEDFGTFSDSVGGRIEFDLPPHFAVSIGRVALRSHGGTLAAHDAALVAEQDAFWNAKCDQMIKEAQEVALFHASRENDAKIARLTASNAALVAHVETLRMALKKIEDESCISGYDFGHSGIHAIAAEALAAVPEPKGEL